MDRGQHTVTRKAPPLPASVMHSLDTPQSHSSFNERSGDHADCIRYKIARVESAAKRELSNSGASKRVQCGRVIELTELDCKANRHGCDAAAPKRRAGNDRGNPPRNHRSPDCVAHRVARSRSERASTEMHDQSQYDRRDGKYHVRATSVETAVRKRPARPNGQASLSRAPSFLCFIRVPIWIPSQAIGR